MFGLQPLHLLIIAIVALVIFGPYQLPKIARAFGETLRGFRKATEETRKPIQEAVKDVREALSERPLLVFVSSIMNPQCDDMLAERAAAKKAIEGLPLSRSWRFEDSPASPESARRVYLRKVKECDIFVLVLGKEITYPVLREYATACKHGKPCLAFLRQCERTLATDSFVRKIASDVKWKDFSAAADLEKQIQIAIVNLLLLKFRGELTANDIIVLTGLLSHLPKVETMFQAQTTERTSLVGLRLKLPAAIDTSPAPAPGQLYFGAVTPTFPENAGLQYTFGDGSSGQSIVFQWSPPQVLIAVADYHIGYMLQIASWRPEIPGDLLAHRVNGTTAYISANKYRRDGQFLLDPRVVSSLAMGINAVVTWTVTIVKSSGNFNDVDPLIRPSDLVTCSSPSMSMWFSLIVYSH